jgi:hypothetical protein
MTVLVSMIAFDSCANFLHLSKSRMSHSASFGVVPTNSYGVSGPQTLPRLIVVSHVKCSQRNRLLMQFPAIAIISLYLGRFPRSAYDPPEVTGATRESIAKIKQRIRTLLVDAYIDKSIFHLSGQD